MRLGQLVVPPIKVDVSYEASGSLRVWRGSGNYKTNYHTSAMTYVGESVEKPAAYFENNVEQGVAMGPTG